jgi:hypothetical protein
MAERRMFTKKITESDAFLDMPSSTQALYFHLNMSADDDGFINNPKKIQRMVGSSDDDMKLLIAKKFIITFDSGVIVIKHWKMHNYIQNDRYKPTDYVDEKSMLELKKNKAYTLTVNEMDTNCLQDVSVGKVRLGKVRLGKDNKKNGRFAPPSLEEVQQYCKDRNNGIDAEAFIAFYESKGWKVGNQPMKNWKSAVITWEKRDKKPQQPKPQEKPSNKFNNFPQRTYTDQDYADLEKKLINQNRRQL